MDVHLDFDIFDGDEIRKEKGSYKNCVDSNIIMNIITKQREKANMEQVVSQLSFLVNYAYLEIWTFESLISNLSDQKVFAYPPSAKIVSIKNISFLKSMKDPLISNGIHKDPRFMKSQKRFSLPINMNLSEYEEIDHTCLLAIPLEGKISGIIIFYRHTKFEREDLFKLMPYMPFIQKCVSPLKNISGGTIQKEKIKDKMKDVFLATVSHELRTPLNGIVGMISMLKNAGPLTPKQQEYLVILMECSHQLMNLLNNMLDFNKMVFNQLVLLKNPFDINKCVEDAILMVESKAKPKGLTIISDIVVSKNKMIGDGQRITQILTNLLYNAVKFTEKGSITLNIRQKQITDDKYINRHRLDISVQDTGIGISPRHQKSIFKVFNQSSDLPKDLAQNGTGLGLSICRELVKLMGGSIQVKSELGKGATFFFHIFCEEEVSVETFENKEIIELFKTSKILIVDDRAEYRLQLVDILFKWGCQSTAVSSGEEAFQYIRHGFKFDTIIVDICMPYMSGVEFAQQLLYDEKVGKTPHTPLLALSSVDLMDKGGLELFDGYLNKPIDQNSLFPHLIKCLKSRDKSGNTIKSPTMITGRIKKQRKDLNVLIAEDDANNSYMLNEMLSYLGFCNIKIVENGQKCVLEAKSKKYDVILMDIKMPIMDGIEATKHIRTLNPRPYIIAVSAAVRASDKQRGQQVGIDSYLPKPVTEENLEAALSPLII